MFLFLQKGNEDDNLRFKEVCCSSYYSCWCCFLESFSHCHQCHNYRPLYKAHTNIIQFPPLPVGLNKITLKTSLLYLTPPLWLWWLLVSLCWRKISLWAFSYVFNKARWWCVCFRATESDWNVWLQTWKIKFHLIPDLLSSKWVDLRSKKQNSSLFYY